MFSGDECADINKGKHWAGVVGVRAYYSDSLKEFTRDAVGFSRDHGKQRVVVDFT